MWTLRTTIEASCHSPLAIAALQGHLPMYELSIASKRCKHGAARARGTMGNDMGRGWAIYKAAECVASKKNQRIPLWGTVSHGGKSKHQVSLKWWQLDMQSDVDLAACLSLEICFNIDHCCYLRSHGINQWFQDHVTSCYIDSETRSIETCVFWSLY